MSDPRNTLAGILSDKKELLRLFMIATVLSFSVGVIASMVAAQTKLPQWSIYCAAASISILSIALLAADLRSSLAFKDTLYATVFVDKESNEILDARGYAYSYNLRKVMAAIHAENKSIYADWEKDPIFKRSPIPKDASDKQVIKDKPSYIGIYRVTGTPHDENPTLSARLLEEVTSFILLEELSTHLSTYFSELRGDEEIKEFKREDIPGFLLRNRVLNLLSTPIEQRDIFLNAFPNKEKRPEGELFSLQGSDGSMYSRFDLTLPKDTIVKQSDVGAIHIETKRFEIELRAEYTGSTAVVSGAFLGCYMHKAFGDVGCQKIKISLNCKIKASSLLSSKGWEYYRWLDSFRERLLDKFDFKHFQKNIHWDSIDPMLFALRGNFSDVKRHVEKSLSKIAAKNATDD